MAHLAERVSDLVDGQLSELDTTSAHIHLAGCRPCRDLVEAERLTKARLAALEQPRLGADLRGMLLGIAGQPGPATQADSQGASDREAAGSRAPRPGRPDLAAAGSRRPEGVRRPHDSRPAPGPSRRRRPTRVGAMATLAATLGMAGVGLLSSSVVSAEVNQSITPSANLVAARHVVTMSGMPMLNLLPAWRAVSSAVAP